MTLNLRSFKAFPPESAIAKGLGFKSSSQQPKNVESIENENYFDAMNVASYIFNEIITSPHTSVSSSPITQVWLLHWGYIYL